MTVIDYADLGPKALAAVALARESAHARYLTIELVEGAEPELYRMVSIHDKARHTGEGPTVEDAAYQYAVRLLADARCGCGRVVTTSQPGDGQCGWYLLGATWCASCQD